MTHATLIIITAAGLLTHYLFPLVILAGVAVTWRADRRRVIPLVLAVGIAGALFVALHPTFTRSLDGTSGFNAGEFGERVAVVVGALVMVGLPVGAALAGPVLLKMGRGLTRMNADKPLIRVHPHISAWFILTLLGGQIALYLLQLTPLHALMDYRYLGPAWPFVAMGIVGLLDLRTFARLGAWRWRLACAGMLILTAISVRPALDSDPAVPTPDVPVLSDNPAAGAWLPVVIHLDANTPVYVGEQVDLLAEPSRWQERLTREGGLYVSVLRYDSTEAGRAAILARLAEQAAITPYPDRFPWQRDSHRDEDEAVYRIGPLGPER